MDEGWIKQKERRMEKEGQNGKKKDGRKMEDRERRMEGGCKKDRRWIEEGLKEV